MLPSSDNLETRLSVYLSSRNRDRPRSPTLTQYSQNRKFVNHKSLHIPYPYHNAQENGSQWLISSFKYTWKSVMDTDAAIYGGSIDSDKTRNPRLTKARNLKGLEGVMSLGSYQWDILIVISKYVPQYVATFLVLLDTSSSRGRI